MLVCINFIILYGMLNYLYILYILKINFWKIYC